MFPPTSKSYYAGLSQRRDVKRFIKSLKLSPAFAIFVSVNTGRSVRKCRSLLLYLVNGTRPSPTCQVVVSYVRAGWRVCGSTMAKDDCSYCWVTEPGSCEAVSAPRYQKRFSSERFFLSGATKLVHCVNHPHKKVCILQHFAHGDDDEWTLRRRASCSPPRIFKLST